MFDPQVMSRSTNTANREGILGKNAGIAAKLLKKIRACDFCDTAFSMIRFS